ncbi:MAG: hypothetical protein ACRELV_04320 [Longimicrobiales bacterium]
MPELIPIVLFVCTAGVLILRPITRPLGRYLDSLARARTPDPTPPPEPQVQRMTELLEHVAGRLDLVEDRVHFMERLVEGRDRGGSARPTVLER